jgi:purine-nucleoside phosphorylase
MLEETVSTVRARVGDAEARVGVVLGSGLGGLADALTGAQAIPYQELPHFPPVAVAGHAGRLLLGRLEGVSVAMLQGRSHLYEGYRASEVAYPARLLCALGIEALLVTNAAGGVNPAFQPGDLMAITDHLNLTGHNPLIGANDAQLGPRFPDLTRAYDPLLLSELMAAAQQVGVELRQGVYAWLLGPSYETPAEIRMLQRLGADAVGMSTVPEVIVARHQGVRVAGISCITNVAAGLATQPLSHEEVTRVAARAAGLFSRLVTEFIRRRGEVRR